METTADFRNFGCSGRPSADELHKWPDEALEAQIRLRKLIRRMSEPHQFSDHAAADGDPTDNPQIPAGYTYLAQLAAHDIVYGAGPATGLALGGLPRPNLRERPLMLDTIYGPGPEDDPVAYELPAIPRGLREKLRLGHIRVTDEAPDLETARDIPRARVADPADAPSKGAPDVLLADPRNDDNVNLSQLTVLFHQFHNAIIKILQGNNPFPGDITKNVLTYRRFMMARQVAAAVYRRILMKDVLPRLIRPEIWSLYDNDRPRPLVDKPDGRVPVEFSDATYRLGHAMVRQTYKPNQEAETVGIRDVIETSSSRRTRETPIRDFWVAEWSSFFEINGSKPQLSRRIGPCYNEILLFDSIFENEYERETGPHAPNGTLGGLLYRDLVRGLHSELRSVDSLAALVPADVRQRSPMLADRAHRVQTLRDWLNSGTVSFDAPETDAIASDPPLLFYLLFEAAYEADGKTLGTLGSVITADVFAGCLEQSRDLVEELRDPVLGAATGELLGHVFGDNPPQSMGELVLFVSNALELGAVEPCFV